MKLLILGFIFIIYSILARKKYNAYWGFLFILIVMGLQSNVDGDYISYMDNFHKLSTMEVARSQVRSEAGWFYMTNTLAQIMSFEFFIFLLSLFEYFILAKFVNKYTENPFRFVAGLIFFFYMNMMLFQMKGLRQGFAIELTLASFMLIDNKKLLIGGLMAGLAISMHTSAIVAIPFLALLYVIRRFNWWNKELSFYSFLLPVILIVFYAFLIVNKELFTETWRPLLLTLDLEGHEGYFGDMEYNNQSILFYLYGGILVFSMAYYFKYAKGALRVIVLLAIIGQFVGDFFLGMGSLFRFSLYFSIFSIVTIPCFAGFLYKHNHKVLSLLFVLLCVAYSWRTFMPWVYRPVEDGFYTYKFLLFG